jgi:hypothetical protein
MLAQEQKLHQGGAACPHNPPDVIGAHTTCACLPIPNPPPDTRPSLHSESGSIQPSFAALRGPNPGPHVRPSRRIERDLEDPPRGGKRCAGWEGRPDGSGRKPRGLEGRVLRVGKRSARSGSGHGRWVFPRAGEGKSVRRAGKRSCRPGEIFAGRGKLSARPEMEMEMEMLKCSAGTYSRHLFSGTRAPGHLFSAGPSPRARPRAGPRSSPAGILSLTR